MKGRLLHILTAAFLLGGITVSCNKDEAEVIPRNKLARIYAEMLVTDQWILSIPGVRMMADTSLVYEPILERYGYDSDDYRKSVEVYMDDPERFSRILRTSGEIIEKRILELEHQQILLDLKAKLPKLEYDIKFGEYFPYMFDEPYVHNYDSISFEPDSALWIYRLKSIERADTIYDRLRMIVLDSADCQAVGDSLEADTPNLSDLTEELNDKLGKLVDRPVLRAVDSTRMLKVDKE